MLEKKYIVNSQSAQLKLERLALEVAEQLNGDNTPLILIGIANSGIVIANKMGELLQQYFTEPIQIISVTLNKSNPDIVTLSNELDFNGKNIIVCDDVANSGKTLLYALKPLLNYAAKRIQILVLVERMHKLFPIKPDYVGLTIATTLQNNIVVEIEGEEIVGAFIQ